MRSFVVGFLCGSLFACVSAVAVTLGSNAECYYEGRHVFSGQVTMTGMGLDGFQDALSGKWQLCTDKGATCDVDFTKSSDVAAEGE
jgi:hypothetical protein